MMLGALGRRHGLRRDGSHLPRALIRGSRRSSETSPRSVRSLPGRHRAGRALAPLSGGALELALITEMVGAWCMCSSCRARTARSRAPSSPRSRGSACSRGTGGEMTESGVPDGRAGQLRPLESTRRMVELEIDGHAVRVLEGSTTLDAAQDSWDPRPSSATARRSGRRPCRVCVVELEGARVLVPACSRKVEPEMKVKTIRSARATAGASCSSSSPRRSTSRRRRLGVSERSTDEARNSSTRRRLWRTCSESVLTFISGSTLREHAGTSTLAPSSSTTQTRHTFAGRSVSP